MADLGDFVSSKDTSKEREERSRARQQILVEEERKSKARQARRKATGEDTWDNPALRHLDDDENKAKKKKKHKHSSKHKKSKHKKHKHKSHKDDASGSDDDWVEETGDTPKDTALVVDNTDRDSWMRLETNATSSSAADPFAMFGATDTRIRRKDQREIDRAAKETENALRRQKLELNAGYDHLGDVKPAASASSKGGWRAKLKNRSNAASLEDGSLAPPSHSNKTSSDSHRGGLQRPGASSGWTSRSAAASGSSFIRGKFVSSNPEARVEPTSSAPPPESSDDSDDNDDNDRMLTSSPPLTDEQLNELAAELVTAELMGDEDEIAELKAKLEAARSKKSGNAAQQPASRDRPSNKRRANDRHDNHDNEDDEEEAVVLTHRGRTGMVMPANVNLEAKQMPRRKKERTIKTHDKDGQRTQYYADDAGDHSLQDLVQRERLGLDDDYDTNAMATVGKHAKMADDDFTLDDVYVARAAKGKSRETTEKQQRDKAIRDFQRSQKAFENCPYCMDSPKFRKQLVVCLGRKMLLMVPEKGHLTEGHCLLVPVRHVVAMTELDEDEYDELQKFQKALIRMYAAEDRDVVFMETSMKLRKEKHTVMHCVPLSRDDGTMAPMFFKKAIMESDAQWSQHKKLIDATDKGLRRSVPKGFPYFHVSFALDRAFAHVIEDETLFPKHFGQEIVGGMLDASPRAWLNPKRDDFSVLKSRVTRLIQQWAPYDCTKN